MSFYWLTNDPMVAVQLCAADEKCKRSKAAAAHLPLAAKVKAYRAADLARQRSYEEALSSGDLPACSQSSHYS